MIVVRFADDTVVGFRYESDAKQFQEELEERYIQASLKQISDKFAKDLNSRLNELYLRNRFREYMRQFTLYMSEEFPLNLRAKLEVNTISIQLATHQ